MADKVAEMTRIYVLLALLCAAMLALAPGLAEARAGGGSSMGSRGLRTYRSAPATPIAPRAAPLERSVTQPAQPQRPLVQPSPSQPRPSLFQRSPFWAGLMGGLIGAGLGGLLFGGGFFGSGMGFAGMLGLLLQLALIGGLAALAVSFFRRQRYESEAQHYAYAMADGPHEPSRPYRPVADAGPHSIVADRAGTASATARDEIGITGADYAEFEKLLVAIQAAWSRADIDTLRRLLTPEMLSYFSERLASDASAGVHNRIDDVRFEAGDLAEAWAEGDLQYATVAMRWAARDYAVRADTDVLVHGSKTEPRQATEAWTFMRAPGGRWLLAAIQQV